MRTSISLYSTTNTAETMCEAVGHTLCKKNMGESLFLNDDVGSKFANTIFDMLKAEVNGK